MHITDRPCHAYCHWFRVCVCFHRMTSTFHYVFTSFLCAFHYKKILPNWQPVTQFFVKKMNFQFRKFPPVNNDKKPPGYGLAAFMNTVLLVCYYYVTGCAYFTAFYGTKTPGNIRFPGVIILRGLSSGKVLTSTCIDLNAVTLVYE